MTKEQFIKRVATEVEESQVRTQEIFDTIINEMELVLIEEGKFAVTGHFSINLKRGTAGGEMLDEPVTYVTPAFKAGEGLKKRIKLVMADKKESKRIHAMLDLKEEGKAVLAERMRSIQDGTYVAQEKEEAPKPKAKAKSTKAKTTRKKTTKAKPE